MTTAQPLRPPIGQLVRQWRRQRRLSQLELSLDADISTRHLSFVETGRSLPSRDMILRLADQLDLPPRERNHLLLAGGYAPVYAETELDSPNMAEVRAAVRKVLSAHEPYPALVVDRGWNIVDANPSLALFTEGVAAELLKPPINALRVALHPQGMAGRIVNLGEWRAHLLSRVRRQYAAVRDPVLAQLLAELRTYPNGQPEPDLELPGPGDIFVNLRIRHAGAELAFFSTVSTFGAPLDITVAELAIESFFPADAATAFALRNDQVDASRRPLY